MNFRFIKHVLFVTLFIPAISLANEVDIALEVTSPQEEQTIGTTVPFYFQITNNSENTATNVVFENDFSSYRTRYETNGGNPYNVPDLSLVSVGSTVGNCELQESIVICHIDSISGKTKAHIDIEMQVEYVGDLKMHAKAFSSQIDNNESNNAQEIIINVSKHNVDEYAELISYNFSNQEFVRGASASPQVSANGRLISFSSEGHLISEISEFKNIFTYDRETQQFHISNVSNSGQYSNNTNSSVRTSSDGNNLIFHSLASNLVNDDNNQIGDLFCHMRSTEETLRISVSNDGAEANSPPQSWDISPDGNYIVFVSKASNLVEGDNNGDDDIFVFDMRSRTISRLDFSHADFTMTSWISEVRVSDNGKYIAFAAWPNKDFSNYVHNLYIWEKETGITKKINILKMPNGSDFTSASMINFSDNGKYVVYTGGNRWERQYHVYKYSIEADETKLISYAIGKQIENNDSLFPSISGDGRFVAFRSSSSNLVKDDINNADDIFVHDAESDTIKMVSIGVGGFQAKGGSNTVDISSDGSTIAFTSDAHNLSLINSDDNRDVTNIYAAKNPFLTEIIKKIDLSISKSTSTSSIEIGSNITYTLSIDNISADTEATAAEVVVTDALSAGLTFVSATPSVGTCSEDAGTVSCNLGHIAVGDATATVEIVATATRTGEIVNTASVSANETDLDISNNSSETTITVIEPVDVYISGSITPATPPLTNYYVGDELTYSFEVGNKAKVTASNITATIDIPTEFSVLSIQTNAGTCSQADQTITCIIGNVEYTEEDETKKAIITVKAKPTDFGDFEIISKAIISDTQTDSNTGNNTNTVTVTVKPKADLAISIEDSDDPVDGFIYAGSDLTYTITATNNGPSDATQVEVKSALPAGVTFASASTGCNFDTGIVTCAIGNIASGDSKSISIIITPIKPETITNIATISAAEYDPITDNNSANESTVVRAVTDMEVISVSTEPTAPDTIYAGDNLIYTVKVKNNAAEFNTAEGVQLTYVFDGDIILDYNSPCSISNNTVTCDIGSLDFNQEFDHQLIIKPDMDGDLNVDVTVNSTTYDPDANDNPTNNKQSLITTVSPAVDLVITMAEDTDPVLVGQNLTYTITVTNSGPSTAENVVLTDTLPGAAPVQSFTTSKGTCINNLTTLDCNLLNLVDDESVTITLILKPTNGAVGTLVNTATVSNDTYERPATPDNKTVSESTTVNQSSKVNVSLKGKGSGSVSGAGISCPGNCEETFTRGDTITLIATPDSGSTFDRWQGGVCSGRTSTCTITLDRPNMNVQASFR